MTYDHGTIFLTFIITKTPSGQFSTEPFAKIFFCFDILTRSTIFLLELMYACVWFYINKFHFSYSMIRIIVFINYLIYFINRHFSHVTKSRIFKNLNFRKKTIATFATLSWKIVSGTWNYIQIPQVDRLEVVVIWAPFERRKIEVHIFEWANLSGFGTWNFPAKEDLIRRKQVFLLDFRPWPVPKPKIWPIFCGK